MVRLFKAKPSKIVDWRNRKINAFIGRKRGVPLRAKVAKLVKAQKAIEVKFKDTAVDYTVDATPGILL